MRCVPFPLFWGGSCHRDGMGHPPVYWVLLGALDCFLHLPKRFLLLPLQAHDLVVIYLWNHTTYIKDVSDMRYTPTPLHNDHQFSCAPRLILLPTAHL